jgi:cell wall-active antibiotic response 4TMS protein YvqF
MGPDFSSHDNRRDRIHARRHARRAYWSHRGKRSAGQSIVIGALIATFGLTLLANNLGWADLRSVMRQFWPFALVIFGIANLFSSRPGGPFWGLVMIVGGIWFYASAAGWVHVPFWAVFGPTVLVLLGGTVVWRAVAHPVPKPADAQNPEQSGYIHTFAVMSGSEHKPSQPFQGADLGTVMGGVKLDLTGADMQGETAVVDVFAVMGGIEIYAPRDWEVVNNMTTFMGGTADQRRPAQVSSNKKLILQGFVLMGGVEIKD